MKVLNKYTTGIVIAFSQLEIAIIENALTFVCSALRRFDEVKKNG